MQPTAPSHGGPPEAGLPDSRAIGNAAPLVQPNRVSSGPQSVPPLPPLQASLGDALEEDLAECITAWQGMETHSNTLLDLLQRAPQSPTPSHWGRSRTSSIPTERGGTASTEIVLNSGPVITVEAGGVTFRATVGTLQRAPFFERLLWNRPRVAEDGGIYLDRSGDLFSYVLNFLRSGHWLLGDRAGDHEFLDALCDEAAFYGLGRAPCAWFSEYVNIWQYRGDTSIYVDCCSQTIREDPDHQGLFRLCKYFGGMPLDQRTSTKRFKATSHRMHSVIAYFAMRGFRLQHILEGCAILHNTSADGKNHVGLGTQYIMHRGVTMMASDTEYMEEAFRLMSK